MLTPATRSTGVTFLNADIADGESTGVRVEGPRIVSLDDAPHKGDRIIELDGDRLLPGLINAHDHLALNNLPRPEFSGPYRHVNEWIADVDAQRRMDGPLRRSVALPRPDRLLLGATKNLLSGVTTVAHHDPLYPTLHEPGYPIHVVTCYGWSHSLSIDGEERVRESHHRTPADSPWIIHAAEGVDADAADEFERLERLGCLSPNTLLVHGVALDAEQRSRLAAASCGLIWCPASNLHLFGKTARVGELIGKGLVALGTDSRLSGSRDLLDELRVAAMLTQIEPCSLGDLVTRVAARLLRLPDRGVIAPGAHADLLILPAATPLGLARRADVRLVMVDGIPLYGDLDCMRSLAPTSHWCQVSVDGRVKALDRCLAAALSDVAGLEAGLVFHPAREAV